MSLLHAIAIFQTVKSKVIISLFETVRLSVSISLRNLYNSLNSIKENIMIGMQKLKFMQEFTFAINVDCLHSSLHAKLLMHNCARVKHAKHVFVACKGF